MNIVTDTASILTKFCATTRSACNYSRYVVRNAYNKAEMAMVRPIAMKSGMVMQLHPLNPVSPVFPHPNALVAVGNSGL